MKAWRIKKKTMKCEPKRPRRKKKNVTEVILISLVFNFTGLHADRVCKKKNHQIMHFLKFLWKSELQENLHPTVRPFLLPLP